MMFLLFKIIVNYEKFNSLKISFENERMNFLKSITYVIYNIFKTKIIQNYDKQCHKINL